MGLGLYIRKFSFLRFVLIICVVNLWGQKADAAQTTILALGDSLTAGYGLNAGEGFPEQLEETLKKQGHDVRVINAGVSGDTTQGGLARLNWALADNPDMVIVELGANDGLRGIDPALTQKNLNQMMERLKAKNIKVLLAGMLAPPNMGEDYGQAYNAVFPQVAKRHQVDLYPFFLEGVAGNPDLNLDDGIHPTKEGVSIIVERILPFVLKVMK